jgi:hypothetical protein
LKLSRNVARRNPIDNLVGFLHDPPPVLVQKIVPASATKFYSASRPVVSLPELGDMAILGKGKIEE